MTGFDAYAPKILVLRGGAIGDFIVTLPVLTALHRRWPRCTLDLVGYPRTNPLAKAAGRVANVYSIDGPDTARLFVDGARLHAGGRERVRAGTAAPGRRACALPDEQAAWLRSYDVIVSYLYDPDGIALANLRGSGAPQVLYGDPRVRDVHAVEHLLKPLAALAIYPEPGVAPELALADQVRAAGRAWLRQHGPGPFVALHPGSGSPAKNWPLPRFLEAGERLAAAGLQPLIILGEADEAIRERLEAQGCPWPRAVGMELVQAAGALAGCAGFLGNDSGISHLAAALGIPTVALYGPTDPALWGVRGAHARAIAAHPATTAGLAMIEAETAVVALSESMRSAATFARA